MKIEDLKNVHAFTASVLQRLECPPIKIGGTDNHIHILCQLNKNMSMADMVKTVKSVTSKWLREKNDVFQWQGGYAAFSVSQSKVEVVKNYIENQLEHHKKVDFKKELIDFLQAYGMTYDEKYLWEDD